MKHSDLLKKFIKDNGSRFMSVTFIKKDGTERTLNGHIRQVEGHNGHNPVSHIEKYVTLVLSKPDANGRVQFRNVNTETITRLSCGGKVLEFK